MPSQFVEHAAAVMNKPPPLPDPNKPALLTVKRMARMLAIAMEQTAPAGVSSLADPQNTIRIWGNKSGQPAHKKPPPMQVFAIEVNYGSGWEDPLSHYSE